MAICNANAADEGLVNEGDTLTCEREAGHLGSHEGHIDGDTTSSLCGW